MNTKTKSNLKRTLAVFLTLLMLMTSWVFVAPSAAAEGESPLIARYYSTDNEWYDAVAGSNQLDWKAGSYTAYQSDGSHYFNETAYRRILTVNLFSGISDSTGIAFSYQWKPDQADAHRHILSLGANEYSGSGANASNSFYISATTSWMSNGKAPFVGYVKSDGTQTIGAYPASAPSFASGQTYNIVVSVSATEGVVFYINGVKYNAGYKNGDNSASDFAAQKGNIQDFLNSVKNWIWNYIGVSRWGDGYIKGYLKDLCIYNRSMSLAETLAVKNEGLTPASFSFVPTVRGTNPVGAGYYSNVVYENAMEFYDGGNSNGVDISGINYKFVRPDQMVTVYDGANPIYVPLEVETKVNNNKENVIHAITSTNAFYELFENWKGHMDGSGGWEWETWGSTTQPNPTAHFSYQNSGDEGVSPSECQYIEGGSNYQQNNTGTSRFWWNRLRFNGTFGTDEYVKHDTDLVLTVYASMKKQSGASTYRAYGHSEQTMSIDHYVINYKPVYDLLKNGTSGTAWQRLAEATGSNAWMYTDQSIANVKTAIEMLLACNPNNFDYASDLGGQVSACANAISDAVTYYDQHPLVKKQGTVEFVDEGGSPVLLAAAPYDYGTAAADITKPADPTKPQDAQYSYTFDGWDPAIAMVDTPSVTYTATYSSTPRTYNVSATGTHISNTTDTTATFGTDYSATEPYTTPVPQTDSNLYKVNGVSGVTIGGNAYTGGTVNADYSVEIPGAAINGDIVVTYTTDGNLFPVTVVDSNNHMAVTALADAQYNTSYSAKYTATLTPADHYHIVSVDSVAVNGHDLSASAYSYTSSSRKIEINSTNITGPVTINVTTAKDQVSVNFSLNLQNDSAYINYGEAYSVVLVPETGSYFLDPAASVTIGGVSYTGFTFDAATNTLSIPEGDVTGAVMITGLTDNTYTVTVGGTNVAAATDSATYGTAKTVTPAAAQYYHITGISGVTIGGSNYAGYTVGGNFAVTIPGAAITDAIEITATAAPNSFNVVLDGTNVNRVEATATYTQDYTVTPTAEANYHITGISSVQIGGAAYSGYTFTGGVLTIDGADITGDVTITVAAEADTHNVTVTGTHVAGNVITDVPYGTDYTVNLATDNVHYTITGVSGVTVGGANYSLPEGAYNDTNKTVTIPGAAITDDVVITAVATPDTFAYSVGGTNVRSASGTATYDTDLVVTPAADTHYHITGISGVTIGGAPATVGVDYTVNAETFAVTVPGAKITDAIVITATAAIDTFSVTVTGTNVVLVNDTATYGSTYTVTPAAAAHYHITGIESVTIGGAAYSGYTFENGELSIGGASITDDIVVTATAAIDTFTVSVAEANNVAAAAYENVPYGTDYTVTPVAKAHYHLTGISSVTIGGEPATANVDYTVNAGTFAVTISGAKITGNVVVTAVAAIDTFTITWTNDDDSEIDTTTVDYGVLPTHADATKTATAEYTYTFTGWDPAVVEATENATYKATFSSAKNSYTITWLDDDDSLIDTTTVEYGVVPTHASPSKTATAEYTYTFADWDPAVVSVTGPATYKAQYTAAKNKYAITWKDGDGNVLGTDQVEYGTVPAYAGTTPTKTATAALTYTFNNAWNPTPVAVTGAAEYTAQFDSATRQYQVAFVDEDGETPIKVDAADENDYRLYDYGTPAASITKPANPTKASDTQYEYTFGGWTPEFAEVTGDATYTATYTSSLRSYEIRWNYIDANGDSAYTTTTVEYGETPVAPAELFSIVHHSGATTYTLSGWEEELVAVTGPATYTATYAAADRTVTVTWNYTDAEGQAQSVNATVAYNTVPLAPVSEGYQTDSTVYTLTGWNDGTTDYAADALPVVTDNATFTANYSSAAREYTITWKSDDGSVIDTTDVAWNTVPTHADASKAATAQYTYTFDHWNPTPVAVTGDATYTAVFESTVNKYTVTWKNYDENVLETDENVEYGTVPTYDGETPTKPASGTETFNFIGWDPEVSAVTGDITYIATFDSSATTYTVTWKNYNNATLETDENVVYGTTPEYNGTTPAREGDAQHSYAFIGWYNGTQTFGPTDTLPPVHGNVTFVAVFEETIQKYTVTWQNLDGTPLKTEQVAYDGIPAYTGETPAMDDAQYTYTFSGWTSGGNAYGLEDTLPPVQGDVTFTAKYDTTVKTYTVIWKNGETTVETDENVAYGTVPSYDGTTPSRDPQGDVAYTFAGWKLDDVTYGLEDPLPTVQGNTTFTAVFTEGARLYTAVFTDNLGGSLTVSQANGTSVSLAKPGYKVHTSSAADFGTIDIDEQTYTFTNSDAAVTVKYVYDVDALLTAAQTILDKADKYESDYIASLRTDKNALQTVCDDPDQLALAATYKAALQTRVNEAPAHKLAAVYSVTFKYGKNGDVITIVNDLHEGDSVSAPPAETTSYKSAGFTYPVAYWTDSANNRYAGFFPAMGDADVTYTAVYTLYDLADALSEIRAAKEIEDVAGTDVIAEIENILSQIDALFADNGVVVSEYAIVQENAVNKETAAGMNFVQTLEGLIGQLQAVAANAEEVCTGHQFDYYDQIMPTCTEPGTKPYKICRLCNTKVGGEPIPATGHSAVYERDPVRSGALNDGTCTWETYTCKNGCGDFYLIPTYIVRYTDGATVAGATVSLFANGQNHTVYADNGGRASFRGQLTPGQLREGEYDLTVSLGETAKTGIMYVHNGRVTISIARLERTTPIDDGSGNGSGGDSGAFRCPMCNAYDDLRSMPVVGWFVAIVHFFVHMAYRIINGSTGFSGKFIFK